MIGPPQSELDVTTAGEDEAFGGNRSAALAGAHGSGQPLEALGGYGGEQLVFAGEMTVGGVVGDAGAAGDFSEGESAWADLADEGNGGVEERLAQIGMVVGLVDFDV